ncbi:MAG: hypothetical protein NTY35_04910 [Planctomycetota bacterium]|nr:hypothetical protein [Planctomycetota bacterium]
MILAGVLALLGSAFAAPTDDKVLVLRPTLDAARLDTWRASADQRPSLRGFRAPVLDRAGDPLVLHAVEGPDARAARSIAMKLARDGLRATLVAAVADLGPGAAAAATVAERLERAGLPVDLLACWRAPGDEPLAERVARELAAGRDAASITADLAALPFAFPPTIPGWRIATESGEADAAAVRLQISSATDYAKPGEGGAMDVLRGLARLLPDVAIVAGVEAKHLDGVEREARGLAAERSAPITLVESPLPLAQWAQDSAKAGFVEKGGPPRVAWLAPRYASRGEDGSIFAPSENLALEGFAATGREVRLSPLLFQGGDLIAVRDPRTGTRYLLVGEAEVARNRALGLTRDEVLTAFRAEFGVDSCIVLPAVSFHIDLEVSVRATDEGLVACVLDTGTAARTVIHCGLDALARAGLLDQEAARLAGEDLEADRQTEFFARVGPLLQSAQHAPGRFTLDFAERFAAGPSDSGVGNLQRFLLALDVWTAARIGEASAEDLGIDPDSFAYLASLRRREVDRMRVASALSGLGWKLVAVPGLSDEKRSLNPLNGLHLRGRYLMPAYGGLFAPLDERARQRLAEAFGPRVRIDLVATGETQRRAGGLHCAAAIEPRLGGG